MSPEETIDFHLRWLWMKTMRLYNLEAARYGGSMSVGYVLLNIDKDGTPSTKLGPKMGIESRSLTRTLKTMEENGLITRSASAGDGRMVLVHLTAEGKKYREKAREAVISLNEYLHENIKIEQLNTFFHVSKEISKLIDKRQTELRNQLTLPSHKTPTQP
jgi:DNA-binding MarR family transcriptional regulator